MADRRSESTQTNELLMPGGHDATHDEQLWRLMASGWAALENPQPATA